MKMINLHLSKDLLRKKNRNLLSPLIVCNEEQRFIVAEQMRLVIPNSILLEPGKEYSAVAGALMSVEKFSDPILLVLPELNPKKYYRRISLAKKVAL